MAQLSRVVWREGMHLSQHHFQMQSRYFEDAINFALSHLFFAPYGLAAVALDNEALRNGVVSMVHARGIMPDGTPFGIPADDPPPAPLDIRERFSPTRDSHLVLLALPAHQRDGANCALNGAAGSGRTRLIAEERVVRDDITGRDEAHISIGRRNFTLALDDADTAGLITVPLARVKRDGRGGFVYDHEYIPPCLQIGASERLQQLLQRLVDILEARSDALGGARAGGQPDGSSRREIATFWLLHAIHSALGPLRHHLLVRHTRPEQLYTELARLAGALCTFALESHPRMLPAYDHERLGECFGALEQHIRAHLELIDPTSCATIPLQHTAAHMHTGTVTDPRCFGRSRWILGVRAGRGPREVIVGVPRLVKVCFAAAFPKLVERAIAGLTLTHIAVPPAAIDPRPDTQYFAIAQEGPCWLKLRETAQVGVYVPDSLPDAELDLLVLLDG
jgi:type VI secretion system protein ImpJ